MISGSFATYKHFQRVTGGRSGTLSICPGDIDIFATPDQLPSEWRKPRQNSEYNHSTHILDLIQIGCVQVIVVRDIKECIGQFDLDVCKVIIRFTGDDKQLDYTIDAPTSETTCKYTIQKSNLAVIARIIRYTTRGFTITNAREVVDKMIAEHIRPPPRIE